MAEETTDWNPPEALNPEWIARVDKDYISPPERAAKINLLLPDETLWDILCFCVEWMGRVAVPAFFGENKEVEKHVQGLGRVLYGLHYFQAPSVLGPPDRDQAARTEEMLKGMKKMIAELDENQVNELIESLLDEEEEDVIQPVEDRGDEGS